MATFRQEFWQKHRGLVWSNPSADDSVWIRAALMHPRFDRVLDIAVEFGLERLREEWRILEEEGTENAQRARRSVERMLANIEKGFARAAA